MVIYRIEVADTLLSLQWEELTAWFGLDPGRVPMVLGGFMTSGAAQVSMVIAVDKQARGKGITTGGVLVDLGGVNIAGVRANKNVWNVLAPSDFGQTPIPIIAPIVITQELALITNSSSTSILNLDVIQVEGVLRKQNMLESLAEMKRMNVEVDAPDFPHQMLRRTVMGDR